MNTTELERRLGEVLREHAEEAMNRTDTQAQLDNLRHGLEPERRRRLTWSAGALAAAAAMVAAALLVSTMGDDSPTSGTDPAEQPRVVEPVDVATGFMEGFAAYDADRVASYLAEGATFQLWWTPPEAWSLDTELGWSEAAGFEMLPGSCEERSTSADGTAVVCPFGFNALGSAELGRGPFADNEFSFTILDGEIVAGDTDVAFMTNGFSRQMWVPFASWIARTHPDDAAVMYKDWPDRSLQATDDRASALWARHVPGYVEAVRAGTAD
jgi:hypothetical protein